MARFLSLIFLVAAGVSAYFDWNASQGYLSAEFKFAPIGQIWSEIHFGSLQVVQPAIERYLSPDIWEYGVLPVLLWPAAPVFLTLSVLFWVIRRRKPRLKKQAKPSELKEHSSPVRRNR
ncbi:MAG: hypothetical protein L3J33_01440 [Rhodobacteraceae bacterium]|nr:hypothetical protein [Paracoccaceae bacterium]